jgi:hypothetical protein
MYPISKKAVEEAVKYFNYIGDDKTENQAVNFQRRLLNVALSYLSGELVVPMSEEEIAKIATEEMLPFAEGPWRKDFPKDNWKWGEEEIKALGKQIARSLVGKVARPQVGQKGE